MHQITKCWNALTNVTDKYPGIKELTFDDSMLATTFTGPNHGKRSAHALLAPLSVIYSSLLRGLPLETGRKNRLEPRNGQEKNKARCYFSHVPSAQSETREGISLGILRTMSLMMLHNRPISQIPQCTRSISHNVPFRTEMCTFLFWMVRCWIWNRCITWFGNQVISNSKRGNIPKCFAAAIWWWNKGPVSIFHKTSYRKISWSLKSARFEFITITIKLTGTTSATVLPRPLSNFKPQSDAVIQTTNFAASGLHEF